MVVLADVTLAVRDVVGEAYSPARVDWLVFI